jgi:hypothetical protein
MRISIAAMPPPDMPYGHLLPIVDALIVAGSVPVSDAKFFQDRDGWRCELTKPIDFDLVRQKFDLPSSILLSEEHDAILCQNAWIEIKGGSKG